MSDYLHEVCINIHSVSLIFPVIAYIIMAICIIDHKVDKEMGCANNDTIKMAKKFAIMATIFLIAYILTPLN